MIRALPFTGKSLALLLSVSAHAAVALACARGAHRAAPNSSVNEIVELAVVDLLPTEAPSVITHSVEAIAAPHHHHPYPVSQRHDSTPHDPTLPHARPVPSQGTAGLAATPAVLAALDASPAAPPRFVLAVGPGTHGLSANSASAESAEDPGLGGSDEPVPEARVDTAATLLSGTSASYTAEAEALGIEANVPLEIVINRRGAVESARVLAHVGYGLDQAALRGIRGYRFSPARRAGRAQAVRMRWLMRFQLR